MGRWTRSLVVIVVLSAASAAPPALAQTGCGGLLQPPCPPASPSPTATPAPTPSPVPAPPLARERYAAIEPMLTRGVAMDSSETSRAALRAFTRVCRTLDVSDVLLAALRRTCLHDAGSRDALLFGFHDCATRAACRRDMNRFLEHMTEWIREMRAANRIITVEVTDQPCRRALRWTGRELFYYERILDIYGDYARRPTVTTARRAARRLGAMPDNAFRDYGDRRRALRAGCR